MNNHRLSSGIGPGERNDRHDLAGFGRALERATGLDPWLPHAWPLAAFPEAHTADGYMPGYGGALRGFQILAGLYPDGVARSGGPTERALGATLERPGRPVGADEVYGGAPVRDKAGAGRGGAQGPGRGDTGRGRAPDSNRGGSNRGGSNRGRAGGRPGIFRVPPPGIRQPVGAGGVNDPLDLLQARRNLARLGYAPSVAGFGAVTKARQFAVDDGLRAYQQARGLEADGRMVPGGPTERAVHAQIGRQQQRLIERFGQDAALAAEALTAGGPARDPGSVAARTLGARMTGDTVEAQQREAWADNRDRMKRAAGAAGAAAGATADSVAADRAGTEGAAGGAKPRDGRTKPVVLRLEHRAAAQARAQAQAQARAEAEKHTGLGDVEHEVHAHRQSARQAAADAAFGAGVRSGTDGMLRGIGIAEEYGVWPQRVLSDLNRQFGHGSRNSLEPGLAPRYLAVLDRLARLGKRRPALLGGLRRLRLAAAVQRHLAATEGALDPDDRSAANRKALARRATLIERTVVDLDSPVTREHLGIAADWLPVIGELKSGVETLIALRNADRARERGDSATAARYGEEAAWGIAGLIPVLSYSKKGRRLLQLLASPVAKHSAQAGKALNQKIAQALERRRLNKDGKTEELPEGFERSRQWNPVTIWRARRRLAVMKRLGDNPKKENLTLDGMFPNGMTRLTDDQRKIITLMINGAKGAAGEIEANRVLQNAGFPTAAKGSGSGRAVRAKDQKLRQYDIATTRKLEPIFGLFIRPETYKGKVTKKGAIQIEVKSGDTDKPGPQVEADKEVKTKLDNGEPVEVLNRKDGLVVVDLVDLRVPTHWIDKEEFAKKLRKSLIGKLGPETTEIFVKDLDDFYRNSTNKNPIPVGVTVLYFAAVLYSLENEEQSRR